MTDIKAVVFDSDGTLMDSHEVIIGAHEYLARIFGAPLPSREVIREHLSRAVPLPKILETLYPGYPLDKLLKANADYVVARTFPTFEGVKELLDALRKQGLLLAIVTGGDDQIHNLLAHHELDKHFASIVHCNRVNFGKPNPEGFLLAVEECNIRPEEAIMVGDSPNDILAGKNGKAGVTIGITHGHGSRQDLMAADCDHIVGSSLELREQLLVLT